MGGGGFMQHASDTNRKHQAQKTARREKFDGNHSDRTMLDMSKTTMLDFSHLTSEQIAQERLRIEKLRVRRNKNAIVIVAISIAIALGLLFWLYLLLREYL